MLPKIRLRMLLLSTAMFVPGTVALANPPLPTGGSFAGGAGSIAQSGQAMTIDQTTARGVINWQSFDVGAGHTVRINNGAGATLNRVTGGTLSTILGRLEATGSLYLVNPQGVVIGESGVVVTGGRFVASTLDVLDEHFMKGGSLLFKGDAPGSVTNLGKISATGGDVILIARTVTNAGTVNAPKGTAALASGTEVLLTEGGDEQVFVRAGIGGSAENSGLIDAAQAELKAVGGNIYALAGNNGGVVRATGSQTRNGRVWMSATGGDITVSGAVEARNADGSGGKVSVSADGAVLHKGAIDARGTAPARNGGTVVMTGGRVGLAPGSSIDTSGTGAGGTVLVGGDRYGGQDPALKILPPPIPNAKRTAMAAGATIRADGGTGGGSGNGGSVVVWSDGTTSAAGTVTARGGAGSGDGGFVEVSGKGDLSFRAAVDTSAPRGKAGTLLLDPTTISITSGIVDPPSQLSQNDATVWGAGFTNGEPMEDTGSQSISIDTIRSLLNNNSLTLEASTNISWNPDATLDTGGLTQAMNRTLTLRAGSYIFFGGTIKNNGQSSDGWLNVVFNSSRAGTGYIAFSVNSLVASGGGFIEAAGGSEVGSDGHLTGPAIGMPLIGMDTGITLNNAKLRSGGGDIILRGKSGFAGVVSVVTAGATIDNTSEITSGTGRILIDGDGPEPLLGLNTMTAHGVLLSGHSTITSSSTASDAITINGRGGHASLLSGSIGSSMGVAIQDATITSNGEGGGISITGTGGTITDSPAPSLTGFNTGIMMVGGSSSITTAGGTVTLTGTAGSSSLATPSLGLHLDSNTTISTNNQPGPNPTVTTGSVTLRADRIYKNPQATITTRGNVTLAPLTATLGVSLGTEPFVPSTVLDVSQGMLSGITADTLIIGSATGGDITVAAPMFLTGLTKLHLMSGGQVTQQASLAASALAVTAGGDVDLLDTGNTIGTIAIKADGRNVGFQTLENLTVGSVDGVDGIDVGTSGRIILGAGGSTVTQTKPLIGGVLNLNMPSATVNFSGPDNQIGRLSGTTAQLTFANPATNTLGLGSDYTTDIQPLTGRMGTVFSDTPYLRATNTLSFINDGTINNVGSQWHRVGSLSLSGTGSVVLNGSTPLRLRSSTALSPVTVDITSSTDNASFYLQTRDDGTIQGTLTGANTTLDFMAADTLRIGATGLQNDGTNSLTTLHDMRVEETIRQDGVLKVDRLKLETFGNIILTDANNRIGTLEGLVHTTAGNITGNVEIVDGAGGLVLSGDIGGPLFRTINIRTVGDLTLAAGTTVSATAPEGRNNPQDTTEELKPGGMVVLSATGNVINNAGPTAVQANRQWLIYSATEAGTVKGGLSADATYNGTYLTKDPTTFTDAARFIYAEATTSPPPPPPPPPVVQPPVVQPPVVDPPVVQPPVVQPPVVQPPVVDPPVVQPPVVQPPVVQPPVVQPPVVQPPVVQPPVVEPPVVQPPVVDPPVVQPPPPPVVPPAPPPVAQVITPLIVVPPVGGTALTGASQTNPPTYTQTGASMGFGGNAAAPTMPPAGAQPGGAPVVVPLPSAASTGGPAIPQGSGHVEATVQTGNVFVTYSQTIGYASLFQGTPAAPGTGSPATAPGLSGGVTAGASSFNTFRSNENPNVTLVSDTAAAPGEARTGATPNQGAAAQ